MTDYDPPNRVQALAGAASDLIGIRPQGGLLKWLRRLSRTINIWFWAIVGLPTLAAGVYYFAIASNLYLSEAKFIVRSAQGGVGIGGSAIGSLLESTGLSATHEDAYAVDDFIMSRDAVHKLDQHEDLRALLSRPEGDFVARFPGMIRRTDFEALYRSYAHFVSVETNTSTGVTTLMVKAFRPQDAQMLAAALMHYSEDLVNGMNARARADTLAVAQREVTRVSDHITQIQTQMTAYRVKQQMLDPESTGKGMLSLLQKMTDAETDARGQLAELLVNSPHSPQIPLVKTRIAALDKLIEDERNQISGQSHSLVSALTEYEHLDTELKLADKALGSAYASLEMARVQAERQQIFLEPIAQPNLADYPLYPRRVMSFTMVFAVCFLAYAIAWLLFVHVREHAAA
jgi:capsular polysaccharide transport system permease protein